MLFAFFFTAFRCLLGPWVPRLAGQGDVVINELTPSDQHDGHRVIVEALILRREAIEVECFPVKVPGLPLKECNLQLISVALWQPVWLCPPCEYEPRLPWVSVGGGQSERRGRQRYRQRSQATGSGGGLLESLLSSSSWMSPHRSWPCSSWGSRGCYSCPRLSGTWIEGSGLMRTVHNF